MSNPFLDILKNTGKSVVDNTQAIPVPSIPKAPVSNFSKAEEFRISNPKTALVADTIAGIPEASVNVFKDILQGTARSLGRTGLSLMGQKEIPVPEDPFSKKVFSGIYGTEKLLKNLQGTIQDVNQEIKTSPFAQKYGLDKYSQPLAFTGVIGGTLLDLSMFRGGKIATKTIEEIPEVFFKNVAKETDPIIIESTLKKIGLDDINAKNLATELAPTKTVQEAKNVLATFGESKSPENPFANILKAPETKPANAGEIKKEIDNSQAFNVDKAIANGEIQASKIYKDVNKKILTAEFAKGRIQDIAEKLDTYKPGLGDEFKASLPEDVTMESLVAKGEEFLAGPIKPKEISKEKDLITEARKYKSAEEFVNNIRGSATQYGEYKPQFRGYGMEDYKNISELGVKPDEMVTIYRGIDRTIGKVKKQINDGDFVTTDFDSASSYTGNPKDVVEMQVPAKTLYIDAIRDFSEEPFYTGAEYVYTKQKVNPMSKSQLTDIWNKAQDGFLPEPAKTIPKPKNNIPKEIKGEAPEIKTSGNMFKPKTVTLESKKGFLSAPAKTIDTNEAKNYKSAEEFIKAQGTPIYHGTNQDFDSFSVSSRGNMTKAISAKEGTFFTDSKEEAQIYAEEADRRLVANEKNFNKQVAKLQKLQQQAERKAQTTRNPEDWKKSEDLTTQIEDYYLNETRDNPTQNAKVIEAYHTLKNPKVVDFEGSSALDSSTGGISKLIKEAKKEGYDGLIMKNISDSPIRLDKPTTHTVVFDVKQIKTKSQLTNIWNKAQESIKLQIKPRTTLFNREIRVTPEQARQAIADSLARHKINIEDVRIFFPDFEKGQNILGTFTKNHRMLGDVIHLYEKGGKVALDSALHESKHFLISRMPEELKKEIFAQAKLEMTPTVRKMLEKDYKNAGAHYQGENKENGIIEEYIVNRWAKYDREQFYGQGKTIWNKVFVFLDNLLAKAVKIYENISEWYKKMPNKQGGFISGGGKKISEADKLIAEGKIRVVSREGRDTYQVQKGGQWVNARDEDSAVQYITRQNAPKQAPEPRATQSVELPKDLAQRELQLQLQAEEIYNNPLNKLWKYANKKEGTLPEVGGTGGVFGKTGDDITAREEFLRFSEDGQYPDTETIRAKFADFVEEKRAYKNELNQFVQDKKAYIAGQKDEETLRNIALKEEKQAEIQRAREEKAKADNLRTEERKKSFEESLKKQKEVSNKKEVNRQNIENAFKEAKIPDEGGLFQKLKESLNPLGSLDKKSQSAYTSWVRERNLAKEAGNKVFGTFGIPKSEGMDIIHKYQAGIETPYSGKIKNEFDALYQETQDKLNPNLGYTPNYLPQIYKESLNEIHAKILDYLIEKKNFTLDDAQMYMEGKGLPEDKARRLGLNPFFTKERVFPNYKVAMQYGLTPRYKNPDQLLSFYRQSLDKTLADKKFLETLESTGKVLPVESAPGSWKPVALPFSKKGYYASPKLAKLLNQVFDQPEYGAFDTAIKVVAEVSKKAQEIALSAGFPKTNVNFFSIGQAIKQMTAGDFKAGSAFIRANFNERSIEFFKNNQSYIEMMANEGIDLSSRIGNYQNVYSNWVDSFKETSKNPLTRKGREGLVQLMGEGFDKAFNEKTFGSFMPQLYIQTFKDAFKGAMKRGLSQEEAQKLAGDITKKLYGMVGDVGRSTKTKEKLSATFFAPQFREGIVNTLFNTGKAGYDFVYHLGGMKGKMDPSLSMNRRLLAGMIITYGLYNLMNKELNGNYMWDNPDNRKFALQIPSKDGTLVYVEFMPSFLAFARNMASGTINLATGDISSAQQQFGSLFSMPVKITSEIIANQDYFGKPIYKDTDTGPTKALKIAGYAGLQVNHPYIKETVNQIQDKKPLYQSVISALELPLKFGSRDSVSRQEFYKAIDAKTKDNARAREKMTKVYENIVDLVNQDKTEEAQAILTGMSEEDLATYKTILKSDKRQETIAKESYMYSTYQKIQKLVNEDKIDEAQAIIDDFSEEDLKAYKLILNRFN